MSRGDARRAFRRPAPWLLLVGVIASLVGMDRQRESNSRRLTQSLEEASARVAEEVERRLRLYQYGLRGARGAVISVGEGELDHAAFLRYAATRDVDDEFRGARGFGFIRRVPPAGLESFLARVREQRPDFAVRELAPHAGDHYVIEYIEPVSRNQQAVGLDIGSEANRRQAAERAMREGEPIVTAPITLVQASGQVAQGLLVLMPVYRSAGTPDSVAAREREAFGWSYTPLVMSEVLAGIGRWAPNTHIVVMDEAHASASGERVPLYQSSDSLEPGSASSSVSAVIYGRAWSVRTYALPGFEAPLNLVSPTHTLVAGLLLSLLLASLAEAARQARARRRELALQQQRLGDIVAHASDAMFGESEDGRIMFWNPASERLFGLQTSEALGQRLQDIARVIQGPSHEETGDASERTLELHDGRRLEVSFSRSAIVDTHGRTVGHSCVIHDISQRRESERRLRNFNTRLEALVGERTRELESIRRELQLVLDAVPSLIASWDRALCCRVANRSSRDWFASPAEPVAGQTMEQLWGRSFTEGLRPHVAEALAGRESEFERDLPEPGNGGVRKTHWRLLPERDGELITGFLAVATDVTEVTRHRDALERERSRLAETARTLKSVLRAASEVSIIATDIDGLVILFNAGAERMLGYRPEAVVGRRRLVELIDSGELQSRARALANEQDPSPTPMRALVSQAERDGAETREWHYLTASGRALEVSQTVTAMRDEDGRITGYLGVARDITASRRAEQAKNEFIATVSHELRTPLTVISGSLKLVNSGKLGVLPEQAAQALRAAEGNSERLGLLINDLLDAEKLAAGMLVFRPDRVDMGEAVKAAVESTRSYLSDRRVQIDVTPPEIPPAVRVDPLRLAQVLVNLLSNAIKFTPPGDRVEVELLCRGGEALICIRDRGPGIPEDFRHQIFERFAQADSSDRRRPGGTGLGLAISRGLVEGMGGRIWFEDAEGGGTRFWVAFPVLDETIEE
ncbi:CHASE domain-containing protein [Pseudomarimonas salicorniae]|uniref:histidine kinase n=1 Tax=Pseudomarimonas salicorniae TaxID=2933270 RepID=A0ABT0GKH7_9GAMM|nr:CHASE domain-containing protein [Lysobacter sp. CAU 1642]MCK7595046.1 CHASE domain-containing protein [Lysobacter sp. CAU 1642]